ncbi:MAG: proline dehydrogenase family protein, partial [Chitinophagaceae bacterium]|nr:proline dehydrogenase family protein [Chitinophagaceae bacterium]
HRTRTDLEGLLALPGSIRLVKGAYDAPAGLAMPRGPQLDDLYLQYAERLLAAHHPCALATHHEALMPALCQLIDTHQPPHYVLERLLGIGNEELAAWQDRGYRCRLYVVYGQEWYLYLCNRLAEYPLHLFRALSDMVG